jgi:predicted carbohydrate-binding protein with CBM5 and CBM33 domain
MKVPIMIILKRENNEKRNKNITYYLITIGLITGGLLMKLGTPFDHFLTHDYTRVTKQDQIDYLKKNEQKMTDYIKQNSKVTSVQWDWESVEVHRGGDQ